MNSSSLSGRILDVLKVCVDNEERREKEEIALFNELSQIDSPVVRGAIVRLCEKIEELEVDHNLPIFRDKEHKDFYYNALKRCGNYDCFRKALFYCLGIDENTRRHINSIYDFKTGSICSMVLWEPWQTDSSRQVTRLAFNLFTSGTPSVSYLETTEEQLCECRKYSAAYIFESSYKKYFWQVIDILYGDY